MKYALRRWYAEMYTICRAAEGTACGAAVELGAGAGLLKEWWPEIWATDVVPYPGLDLLADATRLPFRDGSLRYVGMCNVLHHVSDVEALFRELSRSLAVGGRVVVVDQHVGWISRWVLRYLHSEPFAPNAKEWRCPAESPMSGANGAIASIMFQRDAARFQFLFPELHVLRYRPHTPLRYWLAGGRKGWTLLGRWNWGLATRLDEWLLSLSPEFGSFVEIVIEKRA